MGFLDCKHVNGVVNRALGIGGRGVAYGCLGSFGVHAGARDEDDAGCDGCRRGGQEGRLVELVLEMEHNELGNGVDRGDDLPFVIDDGMPSLRKSCNPAWPAWTRQSDGSEESKRLSDEVKSSAVNTRLNGRPAPTTGNPSVPCYKHCKTNLTGLSSAPQMIKSLVPRAWTCPRCVLHQQHVRRRLASVATAASRPKSTDISLPAAVHGRPGAVHDDRTLRQVFDSPPFWKDFSQQKLNPADAQSRGLFQNRYLTEPDGFQVFASVTLQKARGIVSRVLQASSVDQYKSIVRDLDLLSDLLCRVIDLADFVRATHPDPPMQAAASQAYAVMFEYMNVLNTTTGLNDQLKAAMADPNVTALWSEEEWVVARILMKDFAKSAIDLPSGAREKFVRLSNKISQLGPDFVESMAPEQRHLTMESGRLNGLDPVLARSLTRWGKTHVPTIGPMATTVLRSVADSNVRRDIYMANRTARRDQVQRLEELLRQRAELARLSGYESFAHMTLADKMAKSPESVDTFLRALASDNKPKVQREMDELLRAKQAATHNSVPSQLDPWDKDYYITQELSRKRSKNRQPDLLAAYFSLGTVMQGISRVMHRLYGVRFVPHETRPGETWNSDVRRLDVLDESDGHVAVVYCDLFERSGKNPNPAHFTLRCSRLVSASELSSAPSAPFSTPEEAATDGMASSYSRSDGSLHQLPTIALICDFPVPAPSARHPTLLSFREVQTLFHEMGHAMHSILGRTGLQNVAGTRCATDFAELPSVLTERFAAEPAALALFARHFETDAPLPASLMADRILPAPPFAALDTEAQLLLAFLDQRYHASSDVLDPAFDSTRAWHEVCGAHGSLREPAGTSYQGFFGHLFGYGATYYAYLFDRAIAAKIWDEVFAQKGESGGESGSEPISRHRGERFKDEVLKWGGGRDGWKCVAGVLGRAELAAGDAEAMAEVGRWGVEA